MAERNCSSCTLFNSPNRGKCKACDSQLEEAGWNCDQCTLINSENISACQACGKSRIKKPKISHEIIDEKEKFVCPSCGSSFSSLHIFSEHLELHDQMHQNKSEGYLAQYKRRVESAVKRNVISTTFGKRKIAELDDHIRGADSETVTKGLIPLLTKALKAQSKWKDVIMCSDMDYFSSGFGDMGWGCGYRNTQMICSALMNNVPAFNSCLFGGCGFIPSILGLQEWLEKAWKIGIDADGANQLGHEVYDTKKWIGTSEMYALMTSFRVKVEVIDFYSKKLPEDVIEQARLKTPSKEPKKYRPNKAMMEWIWSYFNDRKDRDFIAPLYFQYDGHSLTIVGCVRDFKNNVDIVLFDPSVWSKKQKPKIEAGAVPSKLKRTIRGICRDKYQIAFVASDKPEAEDYPNGNRSFKTKAVYSD